MATPTTAAPDERINVGSVNASLHESEERQTNESVPPTSIPIEIQSDATTAKYETIEKTLATTATVTTESQQSPPPLDRHHLHDQTQRLPFPRLIAAYLCLCACYFTSYLDMNSVTTALPVISRALNAGATITWTGTAYLLGQTAFQPLYGRLSDIVGRKPLLLTSLAFIVVGDVLCGFAKTPVWLYGCRALSGIGGGGISSLVSIIVSDLVSLRERGKYQGMVSIAIGLGALTGPFVAASLISKGEDGWRWVFWTPSLVASAWFILLCFLLPLKPVEGNWNEKIRKVDWLGVGASLTGLILVLIPINSGGSIWPWHSALIISMLIVGCLSLIAFVIIEDRVAKLPIVPLRLFKRRSPTILLCQGFCHDFCWQSVQYFLPLYFQEVRGYNPLQSAIFILPFLLAQSIMGAISGPVMAKIARYNPVLRTGFFLWTLGTGLNLIFSRKTPISAYFVILAIEGAGVGWVHQPGLVAIQALSRTEDRAVATSTRNLLRSTGSVVGVAVSTAVRYAVTESTLRGKIPEVLLTRVLRGGWQIGEVDTLGYQSEILDAKMRGIRTVLIMLVPLMCLCLLGSFFVHDTVLQGDKENKDEEKATPSDNETKSSSSNEEHAERDSTIKEKVI